NRAPSPSMGEGWDGGGMSNDARPPTPTLPHNGGRENFLNSSQNRRCVDTKHPRGERGEGGARLSQWAAKGGAKTARPCPANTFTRPPLSTQTFATAFGLSPPSSVGGLSCSPLAKGGRNRRGAAPQLKAAQGASSKPRRRWVVARRPTFRILTACGQHQMR